LPEPVRRLLYAPPFDRGGCGIGFVADQFGNASHALLQLGLQSLINLEHRGATDADSCTGDGAGVLTPLPRRLFAREAERLTGRALDPDTLGVGVFFMPLDAEDDMQHQAEAALAAHGLNLVCWRRAPISPEALGDQALATVPSIWHAIIRPAGLMSPADFEHRLLLARKQFERQEREHGAYVPSMSSRTIVYKGLLLAPQVRGFYGDLRDPDYEVPLIVFHQRYSTNTTPTWHNAQPFRLLCHNGEINTLQGNLAWTRAREPLLAADFAPDAAALRPVIDSRGSDSAMLDNVAELLVHGGRDIRHALAMLVPAAWEKLPDLPQPVRDFYAYHAGLTEPWDGPAALVFTDGETVGATLDRNGLRPCRYLVTDDGLVAAASEVGAVPIDPARIRVQGRLGPGQMLAVDTRHGVVQEDGAIKDSLAARRPYGAWVRHLATGVRHLPAHANEPEAADASAGAPVTVALQAAFGYTSEELVTVLRPMVENKVEAIGSMGDDTPPAVLSDKPRPLFAFFRQRFAEVSNPPIDPLREDLVMSLRARLGARGNFLAETPAQARLLELDTPFLTSQALAALRADRELHPVTLPTLFLAAEGEAGFTAAVRQLKQAAETAVRAGAQVLILSDQGVDAAHSFIPAALALGAVHNHLLRTDLRTQVDLVIETGEAREVHHFAVLVGYGAAAVNPYLALATAADLVRRDLAPAVARANYLHALEHGLLKIMSKMGISTADAYCGAQIFETVGLSSRVVDEYFAGTPAHLEGLELTDIAQIVLRWHAAGFGEGAAALTSPGFYKFKRSGELHAFSPAIVHALHTAVKMPGALNGHWTEGYAAYKQYSALQRSAAPVDLHDLLDYRPAPNPLPLSAVESSHSLLWRFSTAAMSHGALSAEAHSTMAIAMNRLDAMSNSGEGGEDPARIGTEGDDRIKQVASARFGVTPAYLVSADELQIKMAQGSKPGEGGQLPGHKVSAEIAAIRHATPGVTLISPPPHHDIYSIEDLAQLVYDLRQINPRAMISVKLVAQSGVGTIATGVAKAGADVILISGSSGGTGASPLSSIKYAGIPFELGLAEAQYMLSASGLRGRVRLRVDGGLRTGHDVVVAALLGADEFGFGTAAVVAEGCEMARACHLNTCPTGIATQRPDLRAKFDATPEQVMAFMLYVAQEVREILASLGLASLDDAIGRVDLLRQVRPEARPGGPRLDLSRLLISAPGPARRYLGDRNRVPTASPLNEQLARECGPRQAAANSRAHYAISNRDRTFGARLSGEIASQFGDAGLGSDSIIDVRLSGYAGQSFGAFGVRGLHLTLSGAANDYVGKGLGGGRLVIHPPQAGRLGGALRTRDGQPAPAPVLAGNTVLYGATGGELFIAGRAGERFAVRNSGAVAVVEGLGDHGCEYMTGGLVISLGAVGYNFGAGMTGGIAYLLDEGAARGHINPQLVRAEALDGDDEACLQGWLALHWQLTGSPRARAVLADWAALCQRFVRITPKDQPTPERPIPVQLPERLSALANIK
jgi:glutamate synthase (ferredoxin)